MKPIRWEDYEGKEYLKNVVIIDPKKEEECSDQQTPKKKNVVIICVGYSLKITDNIEISYGVHLSYAKYNVYIRLE